MMIVLMTTNMAQHVHHKDVSFTQSESPFVSQNPLKCEEIHGKMVQFSEFPLIINRENHLKA
jgi:hypothetical protein